MLLLKISTNSSRKNSRVGPPLSTAPSVLLSTSTNRMSSFLSGLNLLRCRARPKPSRTFPRRTLIMFAVGGEDSLSIDNCSSRSWAFHSLTDTYTQCCVLLSTGYWYVLTQLCWKLSRANYNSSDNDSQCVDCHQISNTTGIHTKEHNDNNNRQTVNIPAWQTLSDCLLKVFITFSWRLWYSYLQLSTFK